jgi:uncharacterized protein with HEPN domain
VPSKHNPADALADIIENADRIQSYLAGMDRNAFAGSGLVRDAIERCLERVCEASHSLGKPAAETQLHPPRGDIRGMGNRLRHVYDRINLDVIWNAVPLDVPGLAADARRALAQLRGRSGDPSQ